MSNYRKWQRMRAADPADTHVQQQFYTEALRSGQLLKEAESLIKSRQDAKSVDILYAAWDVYPPRTKELQIYALIELASKRHMGGSYYELREFHISDYEDPGHWNIKRQIFLASGPFLFNQRQILIENIWPKAWHIEVFILKNELNIQKILCPSCEELFYLITDFKRKEVFDCSECGAELVVTELNPLSVEVFDEADFEMPEKNPLYWGRGGAGILFFSDDEILLTLRSDRVQEPNTWGIPAGAVGADAFFESDSGIGLEVDPQKFYNQAVKETKEELGSLPPVKSLQNHVFDVVEYKDGTFNFISFLIKIPQKVKNSWKLSKFDLNWENDDVRWFPINDLPQNLHFGVEYIMDQVPEYF